MLQRMKLLEIDKILLKKTWLSQNGQPLFFAFYLKKSIVSLVYSAKFLTFKM